MIFVIKSRVATKGVMNNQNKKQPALNNEQHEFYVRCPFGLEKTVAEELADLRIKGARPLSGGVAFFGSLEQGYRACLWLRSASRVLLVLKRFSARNADELYEGSRAINWQEHLTPKSTFAIYARGMNDELRNTQFTALRVKDALCDVMVDLTGKRPSVATDRPDIRLELSLRGNKATLYLDLSGEPLHRREYRRAGVQGEAPMKENLAAGILLMSGWKDMLCETNHESALLFDPLCGSGTLVLEAACMAFDRAPGLTRDYWGFLGWLGHDRMIWDDLLDEADQRFEAKLDGGGTMPMFVGSDSDRQSIELARDGAKRLGLSEYVNFEVASVAQSLQTLEQHYDNQLPQKGMVVSNPPYAHRIGQEEELPALYKEIDAALESFPQSWTLHLITPDSTISTQLLRTAYKTETLYNGKIETQLNHYRLGDNASHTITVQSGVDGRDIQLDVLESGTEQFAARLKKVARERKKWAKREGVSCYRLYDNDLPDYAVAIDRYDGLENGAEQVYYCVAEYKAPREIDEAKAQRRYNDMLTVMPTVLGTDFGHVIAKTREQARGGEQYSESGQGKSTSLVVKENQHTFLTNLSGYLDTGLFLDHRLTRAYVASLASGKSFLNLFAYTATATVYAAGGGASSTTTVDLSNTYLEWSQKNMRLNGFATGEIEVFRSGARRDRQTGAGFEDGGNNGIHRFIRADVLEWLQAERSGGATYDLIFVDPPTFSNSKRMDDRTWSVQRDHVELLKGVASLLSKDGQAIFSCNLRSFKLDYEELEKVGIQIQDITANTIPHDFERNQKIHKCFVISRKVQLSS